MTEPEPHPPSPVIQRCSAVEARDVSGPVPQSHPIERRESVAGSWRDLRAALPTVARCRCRRGHCSGVNWKLWCPNGRYLGRFFATAFDCDISA
jgi:hypothetical protein